MPAPSPCRSSRFSIGLEETLPRILTFVAFGLGFGLPLVLLSLLAGARRQQVVRFITRHHRTIEVVGGLLLIGVGLWDLSMNWDNIRLTLGF